MQLLLIVDMQNEFNNSAHTDGAVRKTLRWLNLKHIQNVVCTQYINTRYSPRKRITSYDGCKEFSAETAIVQDIRDFAGLVIQKSTLSAVTPDMVHMINAIQANTIYIAGLGTESCITATAFGLIDIGKRPIIIEDCCASPYGVENHNNAISNLRNIMGDHNITNLGHLIDSIRYA